MTVTLEIPAEIEPVLSAKTKLFGLALPEYVFSLCETAADDYYSLSVEEIASAQEALADIEGGDKGISLEDFDKEMQLKMEQRKIEQQKSPQVKVAARPMMLTATLFVSVLPPANR